MAEFISGWTFKRRHAAGTNYWHCRIDAGIELTCSGPFVVENQYLESVLTLAGMVLIFHLSATCYVNVDCHLTACNVL